MFLVNGREPEKRAGRTCKPHACKTQCGAACFSSSFLTFPKTIIYGVMFFQVQPCAAQHYWAKFALKSKNTCSFGRTQMLDWWKNGRGLNASSVNTHENMIIDWDLCGEEKKKLPTCAVPLNDTPNSFSGAGGGFDPICRMLALQKEKAFRRGWKMKINGRIWTVEVGVWNDSTLLWESNTERGAFIPAVSIKAQLDLSAFQNLLWRRFCRDGLQWVHEKGCLIIVGFWIFSPKIKHK